MYDLYSHGTTSIRTLLFVKDSPRLEWMCYQASRLPWRCRMCDRLGSLLIDLGIRLKTQALTHSKAASSPNWLIT